MSALVESAVGAHSSAPAHSAHGSTATFGGSPEPAGADKAGPKAAAASASASASASSEQPATNGHGRDVSGVPEVTLNGVGPPAPTPRPAKGPACAQATVEVDSAWGANFWVTLIEPQSQTPFYACPATGQVSWDPPVGNFVLPPSEDGEWWELVDESRGIPYYYHTKTNETVWVRPEGFVIPLGILQNTALCRRLSARYSQVLDVDVKINADQSKSERPAYRRAVLDNARKQDHEADLVNHRRPRPSLRGIASQSTRPALQTPKRSVSGDQYRQGHHHMNHGFGHTQLPPIPASPYQTEESTPPSPTSKTYKGKQREKDKDKDRKDAHHLNASSAPTADSMSRSRSTSSPLVPRRSPPSQSLDAAAERIAIEPTPPRHASSPAPLSPVSPTTEGPSNTSVSPPARPHALTISIERPSGLIRDAMPPSVSPSSAFPPRFSSLSKGKGADKVYGGTGLPASLRAGVSPAADAFKHSQTPPAPAVPRRSMSANHQGSIRTQDIGLPTLDNQATLDLSPVKAGTEGKPILLDLKKNSVDGDDTRYSTGGRPVLPEDLASEIQQFVQTEFARQYFTTHRTGFIFRRKIPVEKMMVWQKPPLQSPLLVLNRALHRDAVKVFKVIQRIMGDRERDRSVMRSQNSENHLNALTSSTSSLNASSTSLPSMVSGILEEERWLLGEGLTHGELRDEIYCQLVKQLTGNLNPESLFRGWQLLCVLLVTFPPSKNFEAFLRSFINQSMLQTEGRVDVMAKYCLQRLSIVSKKGPRGKPPTIAEIETASDAAFNPSTFGEPLDAVIRLQERTYPHLQVPIILPFLADGILALGGTKSEGIFRIPGDGDSVSELKIRIERGYYNLEGVDDPHVPASLLKLWLRELCDPLVPTELYNDCVTCAKDPDACVQMVARLPTINRRVVLFVVSFLQLFLDEKIQSVTKMTSANLALVMAPNLLRCDSESMTVVFTNAPYEQMFVHNLLLHLKCSKVDLGYVPKHGLGSAVSVLSVGRGSKTRSRRPLR